jgi:hypothetical protein
MLRGLCWCINEFEKDYEPRTCLMKDKKMRMVIWLEIPTLFCTGGRITFVSNWMCMELMMLGRQIWKLVQRGFVYTLKNKYEQLFTQARHAVLQYMPTTDYTICHWGTLGNKRGHVDTSASYYHVTLLMILMIASDNKAMSFKMHHHQ